MSELDEKLNTLMSNPQLMQQIMSMAQSLGQQEPPQTQDTPAPQPSIDPAMIQRIAGMAQSAGVDRNQQALLNALGPYIRRERTTKLERAMRAAKMASLASAFLGGR